MNIISVIGAGGHTRSTLNLIVNKYSDYEVMIFDESYTIGKEEFINGFRVSGKIQDINKDSLVFLSIGDNRKRADLFHRFRNQLISQNLMHSTATIEDNINFGVANQIYAKSYINSCVRVGDNNIINTGAILEHEVEIGSHNHVSVGTIVCGRTKIGDNCMIGARAIIIDKISICNDVIIGAGSVVIKSIIEPGTYVGNPLRRVK